MSIKQSIASLVILLSVSFSAFADLVMISQLGTATVNECSGYKVGDVVEIGYSADLSGRYGNGLKCKSLLVGGLSVRVEYYNSNGSIGSGSLYVVPYSNKCPDGQVINPDTGKCENPPPPPFCSRPDTISQMNQFESSCLADGGSPTIICNDKVNPPDLRMSCDVPPPKPDPDECTPDSSDWPACKDPEPEECTPDSPDWDPRYGMCCRPENNWCDTPKPESCVIGGPNWPACATDTDIDPPTGGDLGDPDKPSGGGTGNPDPEKPEPDVDDTSDTLAAIKSMNSDLNAQLTGINNDMNRNQAETKSALDALKASVDLNTDTVVDNANHVSNAIQGQSDMLSDIGNNTNRLLTSANNQLSNGFGQLSSDLGDLQETNQQGFDDLLNKLDDLKPCDPTPENRFCESPHGFDCFRCFRLL